ECQEWVGKDVFLFTWEGPLFPESVVLSKFHNKNSQDCQSNLLHAKVSDKCGIKSQH
ncbi:942_t:CDS:2, partial [Racocetra persica]